LFDARAQERGAIFFQRNSRRIRALREQTRTHWPALQLVRGKGMSDKCRPQRDF